MEPKSLLPADWLLRPAIDRELKQYVLLAYLQRVGHRFKERKLYPHLHELHAHLQDLQDLQRRKEALRTAMPSELLGVDLQRMELVRHEREEQQLLAVIDAVSAFAMPELERLLNQGQELRAEIQAHIHFGPVGVLPLSLREGYLLLRQGRQARVYSYALQIYREAHRDLQYRSVHTAYLTEYHTGITWTYERIRLDLLRDPKGHPNPATFVFETDMDIPHIETFMPLAKQLIHERIEAQRT